MAISDLQEVQTIELGRQGENLATSLQFNLQEFYHSYGAGNAVLIHKRPGDTRPYIAAEASNSYTITWNLEDEDTAQAGVGQAEIRYYVGSVLKKSAVFSTYVVASIMDDMVERPGNVVYMTTLGASMAAKVSSLEAMAPMVIDTITNTSGIIAGADDITKQYSGKKNYKYQFVATSITCSTTPSLTMQLMNGTVSAGSVTINAANSTFEVTATSDFDRFVITPNVDITAITFKLIEVSPAVTEMASVAQLKQNIQDISSVSNYEVIEGCYVKASTGEIKKGSSYNIVKIPLVKNAKYKYCASYNETTPGYAIFSAGDEYITGAVATRSDITIDLSSVSEIPDYGLFSYRPSVVEEETVVKPLNISTQDSYVSIVERFSKNGTIIPEIVIPKSSVAIVGAEWNLYFENVINGMNEEYTITVEITGLDKTKFKLLSDCLRYTPDSEESGNVRLIISTKKTMKEVTSAQFNISAIEGNVSTDKYVVCIGDSLTDSDVWTAEVEHNLSDGKIHSVGTIRNTVSNAAVSADSLIVYNEGRAGWSTTNYAGSSSSAHPITSTERNAFYNNGNFDFSHYMESVQKYTGNGVSVSSDTELAAVVIGLGTNGSNYLSYMVEGLDRMIASIRSFDATVPIIISMITMPAGQDGVGNNNNIQSANELRKRHFDVNKKYIEKYDTTEDDPNIHIAEVCFNLDCKRDFETVTEVASARNPVMVTRQNNNVHPNVYGYLKYADVYFANLVKYMR